jgi:tripartite-type tricarboxylate transporter receptor subunit TctC
MIVTHPPRTEPQSDDRRRVLGALIAGTFAGAHPRLLAQSGEFPSRPIKLIVPFPPGSGTDTAARHFGKKLGDLARQSVVVENRPGANGLIGIQALKAAPPDGHTLFVGSNSTLASNLALFKSLQYDPVADFMPVAGLLRAPGVIIVGPASPARSLSDLVALAKKKPRSLFYGSGSAGYQLMTELLAETAGFEAGHVPFKGASEAVTAVASGTVDFAIVEMTSVAALAKAGTVRALAIGSTERSSVLPDVPTVTEAGVAGYNVYAWAAVVALRGTPAPIVGRLSTWLTQIAAQPDTRAFFAQMNGEVMNMGASDLGRFQRDEIERWKRIATAARIEQQ